MRVRICPVAGCEGIIPADRLFCAAHRDATPLALRRKLCSAWAAYNAAFSGAPRARAWTSWHATVREAVDWHRARTRQGGT